MEFWSFGDLVEVGCGLTAGPVGGGGGWWFDAHESSPMIHTYIPTKASCSLSTGSAGVLHSWTPGTVILLFCY